MNKDKERKSTMGYLVLLEKLMYLIVQQIIDYCIQADLNILDADEMVAVKKESRFTDITVSKINCFCAA